MGATTTIRRRPSLDRATYRGMAHDHDDHDHHHDHDHGHHHGYGHHHHDHGQEPPSDMALRVKALASFEKRWKKVPKIASKRLGPSWRRGSSPRAVIALCAS